MNISGTTSCAVCGRKGPPLSSNLPVCRECIISGTDRAVPYIDEIHRTSRRAFGLPVHPPREGDVTCPICVNRCRIPENERGFCGLRKNSRGRLETLAGTSAKGMVSWYYDPLPTNCVAGWVCAASDGVGYPDYSYSNGTELGYQNLAVFYEACTFNCLFCQNWHYRERTPGGRRTRTASDLADAVTNKVACICYFGGDPTAQAGHALAASRLARERNRDRILRICWETNGSMRRSLLRRMARLSLESGGCIKFDLKAYDDRLNRALCGTSNRQTFDNFAWLAEFAGQRPDPPLVIASTLLVPGYIDADEVAKIARFIASLDKNIPYSLLAFYPTFYFNDLPRTSRNHAEAALDAARAAGLRRVHLGNRHLLSDAY